MKTFSSTYKFFYLSLSPKRGSFPLSNSPFHTKTSSFTQKTFFSSKNYISSQNSFLSSTKHRIKLFLSSKTRLTKSHKFTSTISNTQNSFHLILLQRTNRVIPKKNTSSSTILSNKPSNSSCRRIQICSLPCDYSFPRLSCRFNRFSMFRNFTSRSF